MSTVIDRPIVRCAARGTETTDTKWMPLYGIVEEPLPSGEGTCTYMCVQQSGRVERHLVRRQERFGRTYFTLLSDTALPFNTLSVPTGVLRLPEIHMDEAIYRTLAYVDPVDDVSLSTSEDGPVVKLQPATLSRSTLALLKAYMTCLDILWDSQPYRPERFAEVLHEICSVQEALGKSLDTVMADGVDVCMTYYTNLRRWGDAFRSAKPAANTPIPLGYRLLAEKLKPIAYDLLQVSHLVHGGARSYEQ